jgi:hypothetical protein
MVLLILEPPTIIRHTFPKARPRFIFTKTIWNWNASRLENSHLLERESCRQLWAGIGGVCVSLFTFDLLATELKELAKVEPIPIQQVDSLPEKDTSSRANIGRK